MTKFEFIQEAALRILARDSYSSMISIADYAAELAEEIWNREPQNEEQSKTEEPEVVEDNDHNEYVSLYEEVENWPHMKYNMVSPVMEALTQNGEYVTLNGAKGLSMFYERFDKELIREALENGEIEGIIPETKTVQLMRWDYQQQMRVPGKTREQKIGRYEVDKRSLILWLEKNYTRSTRRESLINKYIVRIIKNEK